MRKFFMSMLILLITFLAAAIWGLLGSVAGLPGDIVGITAVFIAFIIFVGLAKKLL
ncbi:hypothetical protein [Halomonas sp. 11-S5]|uniref:hypothetical protein n=1 Tax=Halomonas sp. 11-S5 TaxID=2994064 RepID=UPI00246897BB|nr:hypothetical protein [Halomonas sp. 11-S5]